MSDKATWLEGMQMLRGLIERPGRGREMGTKIFLRGTHQQVFIVKNMHLFLHSSTSALVTKFVLTVPKEGILLRECVHADKAYSHSL